jgi:tetratricopeptide (TPR) repeat protein
MSVLEAVSLEAAEQRHPDGSRAMAYWNLAIVHLRHGQSTAATDYFEQSIALGGDDYQGGVYNIMVTARELGVATDTSTARLVDRLGTDRERPRNALTIAAIKNGGADEAVAMADRIEMYADSALARGDTLRSRNMRGEALALRGRIAAAHDSVDSAISLLRRGLSMVNATRAWSRDVDRYWLAHLVQDRGGEEEAISIYGSLYWNPWTEALGNLHRAELHERRGEVEQAARYYARFIALWDDADPHLQPQVQAARRALDRLRGERMVS